MIANQFTNILMPSDTNGCWFWRAQTAVNQVWALGPNTGINNSVICKLTGDQNFYKNLNMFMVQRLLSDEQYKFFMGMLVPYSNAFNFWTVYNIDDAMHYNDIPHYNRGRAAFRSDKIQNNIREMLNASDFVLTTTDYIKEYYHRVYGVPLENIIALPNLLPRWWIGNFYDNAKQTENFRKNKKKLRVGIISSLSHYNIDNLFEDENNYVVSKRTTKDGKEVYINEINQVVDINKCHVVQDDMDLIIDVILKSMDDIQWVICGYTPPKLERYIKEGKIEVHRSAPITNYPALINSMNLNAIVAPIIDGEFNRCKSNIKWLECCALGVPLFASNMITYNKYMPESQLFKNSDELLLKLEKLQMMSANIFSDIIAKQWRWLNSPTEECGWKLSNWWLEDNIDPWIKLFSMRQKGQTLSFSKFLEVKKQQASKQQEPILQQTYINNKPEEVIFQKNGIEIVK
jgi:hypothetical protein